jgi:intracellular septation protein A
MKELLHSAKYLAEDMASMILFLVVLMVSHQVTWAVAAGMVLGGAQIAWHLARREKIDAMTWLSVSLVICSGTATLLTHDPRFVMIKPSVISAIVGIFMCKPGWMNRYLPEEAQQWTPDVGVAFGFVWAGLMFFSAILNIVLALTLDTLTWAKVMAIFGPVSMVVLFLIQFSVMRTIGRRRYARAEAQATVAA